MCWNVVEYVTENLNLNYKSKNGFQPSKLVRNGKSHLIFGLLIKNLAFRSSRWRPAKLEFCSFRPNATHDLF